MVSEVILDDYVLKVLDLKECDIEEDNQVLKKIQFDFKVRGGNEYHDVTVLLYKTTFDVKVPELDLAFKGTIINYSTSRTDFSDERNVADFHLEIVEVK
ncbi:DUF3219 family protein [Paenisporosarcina sp. TG20]|uniref:DUF3219 family protein n=1 Tax=Paenisporosarcina sp. TG20 TaxID=1211706 RepID=UPI0002E0FFD6|nr:DUF3219 family protein [Paenisporosarcina sp. TG20]